MERRIRIVWSTDMEHGTKWKEEDRSVRNVDQEENAEDQLDAEYHKSRSARYNSWGKKHGHQYLTATAQVHWACLTTPTENNYRLEGKWEKGRKRQQMIYDIMEKEKYDNMKRTAEGRKRQDGSILPEKKTAERVDVLLFSSP